MSKAEIRREAIGRQGRYVDGRHRFFVPGDQQAARFEEGSEGVVQLVVDTKTQIKYRVKCFWDPNDTRRQRSRILAGQKLADPGKPNADALAGAPFALLEDLEDSPVTQFAVVMKNVPGVSWSNLREFGKESREYPAKGWPPIEVRATWSYGLATAVKQMEARTFIHADLSPGNVMVTSRGDTAGDMALVDFDGFVHPLYPHLDSTIKGWEGYAAPEVFHSRQVNIGTDRVGMAILVQEFLVAGDPDISKDEAFTWMYDQEKDIGAGVGQPHPLFAAKYPELAELLVDTLRAPSPHRRPGPDQWRPRLAAIAEGRRHVGPAQPLGAVWLEPVTGQSGVRALLRADHGMLDLLSTPFGIRASLQRAANGTVDIVVHQGAELRTRPAGSGKWDHHAGGARTEVAAGMTVFDEKGKLSARLGAEQR